MRLGTAPITWGVCEMDGWGERLPYDRVLDDMAELGYAGTELGPPDFLPTDTATLHRELRRRNLELMAAFCPATLHRPDAVAASLAQAAELSRRLRDLDATHLVLADAGSPERLAKAGHIAADGSDGFDADEWALFAEGVQRIADDAASVGLSTAFHPEAGSYVETESEIDRLLALTDPGLVGLCLDTGHVAYGGGDAAAVARRHARRIGHVHAKDVNPGVLARVRRHGLDYLQAATEGIFAPVGQGCVDFPGVIRALREARYEGWLIVEQDVRLGPGLPDQSPRENARASRAALLRLVGTAPG